MANAAGAAEARRQQAIDEQMALRMAEIDERARQFDIGIERSAYQDALGQQRFELTRRDQLAAKRQAAQHDAAKFQAQQQSDLAKDERDFQQQAYLQGVTQEGLAERQNVTQEGLRERMEFRALNDSADEMADQLSETLKQFEGMDLLPQGRKELARLWSKHAGLSKSWGTMRPQQKIDALGQLGYEIEKAGIDKYVPPPKPSLNQRVNGDPNDPSIQPEIVTDADGEKWYEGPNGEIKQARPKPPEKPEQNLPVPGMPDVTWDKLLDWAERAEQDDLDRKAAASKNPNATPGIPDPAKVRKRALDRQKLLKELADEAAKAAATSPATAPPTAAPASLPAGATGFPGVQQLPNWVPGTAPAIEFLPHQLPKDGKISTQWLDKAGLKSGDEFVVRKPNGGYTKYKVD